MRQFVALVSKVLDFKTESLLLVFRKANQLLTRISLVMMMMMSSG